MSEGLIKLIKVSVVIFLVGFAVFGFMSTSAVGTPADKIRICHATASESNPYTNPMVDMSSIDEANNDAQNGHGDHEGDIIPPFSYTYTDNGKPAGQVEVTVTYPGKNWTTGEAIWNNNCNVVEPSESPTPTPTVTESETPTPTPTTESPTPTPEVTTATPTPEVTTATPTPEATKTPKATKSAESDFDKAIAKANKNKPSNPPVVAEEMTTLPKTGPSDVTPWILILGAILALLGTSLKVFARNQ